MGKELLLSRDTLEIGAQYAVMQEDIPGFERYMAQLQTYYHDHQGDLPDSPFQYQLLGLNLLCLLSQNRVAEFHTELERLPAHEVQSNVYIKHPVSLEQYIMEGSYNKVLLAEGNVPAESYKYFIDILMTTVRSEIASCLEKAYADISCSDAARMLSISAGDINAYAECAVGQHGDHLRQRDGADCVVFPVDKSFLGEDFELMRREKRKTSVMEHN